jgi:2-hydroxy-3-oxopropionate reductase
MGMPMARRLLEAGHPVSVWNRTPGASSELAAAMSSGNSDLAVAPDPVAAVTGAQLVITMLSDGPAVREVIFGKDGRSGALAAMIPGACLVDMSSIPPAMAREHAAWLSGQGLAALDGPVSGGVVGAREGTLAIMVGGDPVALESVRGPLSELGRVTHVGPAGSGQLAKLANQVIVGITIGAVAEALLLAARGGADPAAVRAAIRGGFAESRILELHGARMLAEDFTPGGSVLTQLKDLATALEEARMTELQLPITGLLHTLFAAAGAHGDGGLDHSALLRELARENALPLHDILSRRDAQA